MRALARRDWLPALSELDRAPEFAVLAALRAVLPIASDALLVATPELADDHPQPPYALARTARTLLADLDHLRISIDRYRAVVATLAPPIIDLDDPDFPF